MRPSSLVLTSSKLSDALNCPASFFLAEEASGAVVVNKAAERGTLIHSIIEEYVTTRSLEAAEEFAKKNNGISEFNSIKWDCVNKALNFLGSKADVTAEQTITIHGKLIEDYSALGDAYFAGTADIVAVSVKGDAMLVLDWKTGAGDVEDPERNAQLHSLAAMARIAYGHAGGVWVAIANPIEGTLYAAYVEEPERILAAIDAICKNKELQKVENFGKACIYCSRKKNCATFAREAETMTNEINAPISELVEKDPETWIRRAKLVEAYAVALKQAVESYGDRHGGYKSDSVSLKKVKREQEKFDPAKAKRLLEEQGFDVLGLSEVKVTEDSIIASIGEEDGGKLISELKTMGASKSYTTEYWKVSVKE